MHTTVKVAKQAKIQVEKAASWVKPLEDVDDFDQEAVQEWLEASDRLYDAINAHLEGN